VWQSIGGSLTKGRRTKLKVFFIIKKIINPSGAGLATCACTSSRKKDLTRTGCFINRVNFFISSLLGKSDEIRKLAQTCIGKKLFSKLDIANAFMKHKMALRKKEKINWFNTNLFSNLHCKLFSND
jgi:hypothetical protein